MNIERAKGRDEPMTATIDTYGWTSYCPHTVKRHSARSIEHDWTYVDIVPHVRTKLVAMGVLTMGDLARMTEDELLKVRGVGPYVLAAIKQNLSDLGLALKVKRAAPSPTKSLAPRAPIAFSVAGNVIRPAAWGARATRQARVDHA
jgi:hypothetical protein